MFTGLVEGQGVIAELHPEGPGLRLVVELPATMRGNPSDPISVGDSIAINGCCLTVTRITTTADTTVERDSATVATVSAQRCEFQAGSETLSKTNLGRLGVSSRVNLERALRANARLGGHFVQGHVDGIGTVLSIRTEGDWVFLRFQVPAPLAELMVSKGSVTVDGVSLTVVDADREAFSVALVPHTLAVTTLGQRLVGDAVNIETDILGKYAQKLLAGRLTAD